MLLRRRGTRPAASRRCRSVPFRNPEFRRRRRHHLRRCPLPAHKRRRHLSLMAYRWSCRRSTSRRRRNKLGEERISEERDGTRLTKRQQTNKQTVHNGGQKAECRRMQWIASMPVSDTNITYHYYYNIIALTLHFKFPVTVHTVIINNVLIFPKFIQSSFKTINLTVFP